eukprot:TRINITY_DN24218_c0_g1_i1.p1 TRINITY_DN24218_c0_g1~~TRINITY_DN24218_c0_g1_i1.p1  ORF type:complete len:333 (+),score=111.39 TRINITY_DN24218_c0_g1_i1:123-1121(+)
MQRAKVIASHLQPPVSAASGAAGQPPLVVHPEVAAAVAEGRPVVALESTIISHGMPYPQNVETARRVEAEVRKGGAVPATIAVLGGRIRVGLGNDDLELLGRLGPKVTKCSRRDLAFVLAAEGNGATTVSATMLIAHLAGIEVFVTGGCGGVHRGGEVTMDVSADLTELGATRVAVVCAGVKSILDIPRTLEYLETQGVPVCTLGAKEFPAFFTRHSGCQSPMVADSPQQMGRMLHHQRELGLRGGMLFAVPIPEAEQARAEPVQRATERALQEAAERGISGRDITPFLLLRISELTKGESLNANIALVMSNARAGSAIAVEAARLRREAAR